MGRSATEVEEAGLFSCSKLRRMETGQVPVRERDVRLLCHLYGADLMLTEVLAHLSEDNFPGRDHWWDGLDPGSTSWFQLYRGLEGTCGEIFTYDPDRVHGLLQTDEYTDYVIGSDGETDPEVLQRRRDVLLHRKLTFFGREEVRMTTVLGVAALAGGAVEPGVVVRQYRHLCDLSSGERIDVRVLPATLGVRARFHGPFTLFDFEDFEDPTIAYVETHAGAHYFEGEAYVAQYRRAMTAMISRSIPVGEYDPGARYVDLRDRWRSREVVALHDGHLA